MHRFFVLLIFYRINDDTDGKEVVDTFKLAMLFFHLLPDGMDALCTSFDMEMQTNFVQPLRNWLDKLFDIGIAAMLSGTQFFLNVIVGIVL